jgi:N6-adenosine-specific RNA methylase IME4
MNLATIIDRNVPAIRRAKAELVKLGEQLDSARTYDAIRKVERRAEAIKVLFREVDEVKHECEIVIIDARARIGEELKDVPKVGPRFTPRGKSKGSNKGATGVPGTSRSRYQKLADLGKQQRHAIARDLQAAGKDATVKAILAVVKEGEIKHARKQFEARRDNGARVTDLIALAETGQKFNVIAADPPWEFKVYSGKGKQRSAERHYDTESLDGIRALGRHIAPLAADDCMLFLWGVWPEFPGALDVIRAWGFEYKTMGFIWVKATKNAQALSLDGGGLHWGMGYHTRANTEPVLIATRGNPKRAAMDVHQVVIAPVGEHSQKPDEVYSRIERLCIGPYLELFGRKCRKGWTVWGNELAAGAEGAA